MGSICRIDSKVINLDIRTLPRMALHVSGDIELGEFLTRPVPGMTGELQGIGGDGGWWIV